MRRESRTDDEPAPQALLTALEDDDCRAILRQLTTPQTATELMDACDLSQTTTYRKLDLLSDTELVAEQTNVRDDGHHTTSYERTVDGLFISLDQDSLDVTLVDESDPEPMDETLARVWGEVGDQL
jgi:DNA-binding transcriptional ArsR family regulator